MSESLGEVVNAHTLEEVSLVRQSRAPTSSLICRPEVASIRPTPSGIASDRLIPGRS